MTSISSVAAVTPSTPIGSAVSHKPNQVATSSAANISAAFTPVKGANASTVATASRQVEDPLAGVLITQSVGVDGQVVNQFPSTAVVAYLREGLSSDGGPLPKDGAQAQDNFA